MTDNKTLWHAYLWESWGPSPERERNLQELEDKALIYGSVGEIDAIRTERARGKRAYQYLLKLQEAFERDGKHAAQQWLNQVKKSGLSDGKIIKSLKWELDKRITRQQQLRNRYSQPKQRSKVRTRLLDGHHPNCLRTLEPADSWTIYVDETGSEFDGTVELPKNSKKLGRVVALAVPDGVKLIDCDGFHAVERTFSEVDQVLQRVLDARVGILGFSISDDTTRHRYWIGHVLHLIRWTLLQLPVPTDGRKSRVRILIEQRGTYGPQTDLKLMARALESEVAAIDPQRFTGLALNMEFMGKNHPMNGYVDVIAFTWGSSDWLNKDRLRKSQLLGHCFIKANERSLHHLFLALTQGGPLAPADWYMLCTAATNEHKNSFLNRELDRLGKDIARYPRQWELYLAEVQSRLIGKQYSLAELGSAIAWLQQHTDRSQAIPGTLHLQLVSSSLALANHRGQVQPDLLFSCLEWVRKLEDEASQLGAEALLRMASTMTNNFEFNALEDTVDKWLSKPIAVAGLLNYGKLQSTRGQMHAFSGNPSAALPFFTAATESFARLCDPRQVDRETHQTAVYELIARMDAIPFDASDRDSSAEVGTILYAIRQLLGNHSPETISRSLSVSDQSKRFEHHLWLRAMIHFPEQMAGARAAYLDNRGKWQTSIDHPWPLIFAYRAWLLVDAGEIEDARGWMEEAVAACLDDDHGVTLEWMALVFGALAQALALTPATFDMPTKASLRARLPHAPWLTLSKFIGEATQREMTATEILTHLAGCLPFNFH